MPTERNMTFVDPFQVVESTEHGRLLEGAPPADASAGLRGVRVERRGVIPEAITDPFLQQQQLATDLVEARMNAQAERDSRPRVRSMRIEVSPEGRQLLEAEARRRRCDWTSLIADVGADNLAAYVDRLAKSEANPYIRRARRQEV